MTKAELTKQFPAFSPKRAFEDAGEGAWQVTGKHVKVQWITNIWDVYIRTGQKRCNTLVSTVPAGVFCKVADDGEAWCHDRGRIRAPKTPSSIPEAGAV